MTVTDEQVRTLRCDCGKPAACIGQYADHAQEDCAYEGCTQHRNNPACDDCCGHACEDGHCDPIYDEDGMIDDECRARVALFLDEVAS